MSHSEARIRRQREKEDCRSTERESSTSRGSERERRSRRQFFNSRTWLLCARVWRAFERGCLV